MFDVGVNIPVREGQLANVKVIQNCRSYRNSMYTDGMQQDLNVVGYDSSNPLFPSCFKYLHHIKEMPDRCFLRSLPVPMRWCSVFKRNCSYLNCMFELEARIYRKSSPRQPIQLQNSSICFYPTVVNFFLISWIRIVMRVVTKVQTFVASRASQSHPPKCTKIRRQLNELSC